MFGMGTKHAGLFAIVTTGIPFVAFLSFIACSWTKRHPNNTPPFVTGCTFILYLSYLNTARCMELKLNSIELGGYKKLKEMDNLGRARVKQDKAHRDAQRAIAHSLKFNNSFFLFVVVGLAYFVFVGFTAPFNYIMSVTSAAALVYYGSTKELAALAHPHNE